jgi:hypothetical protein
LDLDTSWKAVMRWSRGQADIPLDNRGLHAGDQRGDDLWLGSWTADEPLTGPVELAILAAGPDGPWRTAWRGQVWTQGPVDRLFFQGRADGTAAPAAVAYATPSPPASPHNGSAAAIGWGMWAVVGLVVLVAVSTRGTGRAPWRQAP